MFCQICVTDVETDRLILTEVVAFINSYGGKIKLDLFKTFFRLRSNSDWKCRLKENGDDELNSFCENSNGELTWATDGKGEVTVSTKFGQCESLQPCWWSSSASVSVADKVS